ncbi:hypothetical protein ACS0TY_001598 [Phlomoides rotata]
MGDRRESSRQLRSGRNHNISEAIAQLSGGDAAEERRAPMRMKIVVKKEDLKHVLAAIRDGRGRGSASTTLEQRRRQMLRGARGTSRLGSWLPALQSIPE